jgi:hypothetical protein
MTANYRSPLDARTAPCLHIADLWRDVSELNRSGKQHA